MGGEACSDTLTGMGTITVERRVVLIAGDGHPQLAEAVARLASVELLQASVSAFADGESRIKIDADIQDADVYILQPTCTPTNERLMTLALMADAARGAGAARVTAVMPYFGYARQDVVQSSGEPHSARLAAGLLRAAGVDCAVAMELHSPALESAFDMRLVHLRADEALLPAVRHWGITDLTIVSPDAGGLKRAQRYASALEVPVAVVAKTRPAPDVIGALHILGNVRDRSCLLVDDMSSTGATLVSAAHALMRAEAREVHALFVHAVLAPSALEHIRDSPLRRILTTDSVPAPTGVPMQVVSVAPILVAAIKRLTGITGK
jgi:ribose-phosphate pyrophosphokinase